MSQDSGCDNEIKSNPDSPTNFATCPSTPAVLDISSDVASDKQQSYGGADISWPNLLPINVGDKYDPKTSTKLFLVLPGSFMDKTTYRSSFQGMGADTKSTPPTLVCPSGKPLDDKYAFPVMKNDIYIHSCMHYQTITTYSSQERNYNLMTGSLEYKAKYPAKKGYTTPGNDTKFNIDSSNMFQFYFSASLPVSVYDGIVIGNSTSGQMSSNCTVQPLVTDCQVGATTLTPNLKGADFPTGTTVNEDSLFLELQGVTGGTAIAVNDVCHGRNDQMSSTCEIGTLNLSTCVEQEDWINMSLYAHMRDDYQRIPGRDGDLTCNLATNTDPNHKEWSAGCQNGFFQGRLELGLQMSNSKINAIQFPVGRTCTDESSKANAHYLIDMQDKDTVRSMFYTLTNKDTTNNLYFAESYMDNGTKMVKSFNIRGRLPGCLSSQDANPKTESPYLISKATDYINVGATLGSNADSFTWIPSMDLKGDGNTYATQKPYDPTNGSIWDSSDKDLANWPDTQALRSNVPDIVVRIIFYNPAIFDPTKNLDNLPVLTQDAIINARSTMLQVFQQNTPNLGSDVKCNQLFLKAFERGVAFIEFITTIVYSLIYQYNLDGAAMQAQFFEVSYHVYMPKGKNYTVTDFTRHIYNRMSNLKINDKAAKPTLLSNQEDDRLIQEEFDSWVNETLTNTHNYLHYPSFCQPSSCNPPVSPCTSSYSDSTLYIEIHMHPMMHANMQTNNQKSLDTVMEIYLNNFFQDLTNQIVGGATIIKNTKSYGVLGNVSVQKDDTPYEGPSAQPMRVACTQQIDTLDLTDPSTKQTYSISYRYRAQVTQISVGGLIYLLQHNDTFKIDLNRIPTRNNPSLPIFMTGYYDSCLKQTPISQECVDLLCNEQMCACDFSVVVGMQKTLNPQSDKYMNNSNGPCACLAPFSYPKMSSGRRALNPVGLCFSKACDAIKMPSKDPSFCEMEACSELAQSIHENNKNENTWYDVFSDKGVGIDLNKLNNTCHTNYALGVAPARLEVNWYILGGALCMAMAAPLALALDRFGMRQRRSKWAYWFWFGIIVLMLMVSGLLFYMLSGVYKCDSLLYTNIDQAMCYDRLTQSIPLTREACDPHLPLFCQCTGAGDACTNYVDSNDTYQAQCMIDGVCAICPNDARKIDVMDTKDKRKTVPTTWAFLAIGAWCLVAGLVCVTLGSYFKNLGLTITQRVGILIMVGIALALMGFGALIAGMNHTQSSALKIDTYAQRHASNSPTDPCK